MSKFMTVFFGNGFSEHYFPAVDNRKYPVSVNPSVSGLDDELTFNIEVWGGTWTIYGDRAYTLMEKGESIERAELRGGLVLEGIVKKSGAWFSLKIDETDENASGFTKYIVKREAVQSLVIGSADDADISCRNKYVSERHAQISFEGGFTFVNDLGSVNGTFLNGRKVTEKTPVRYGDVVYVVGLKVVCLGPLLAVNRLSGSVKVNRLTPVQIPEITDDEGEEEYEKQYFHRTPRQLRELDTTETVIERCPPKQPYKQQPLIFTIGPAFTMVIPIALAAMMSSEGGFGASSLVMSGGAAAMAAAWAIANAKYNKKEAKAGEQTRQNSYLEYIAGIESRLKQQSEYNSSVLAEQYPSADEMFNFVSDQRKRLWEKSSSHRDFLSARLGLGSVASPSSVTVANENGMQTYDPLNELGKRVCGDYRSLRNVPVSVSLYDNRLVGVVSSDAARRYNLLRLLTLNLTANFPYTEVRTCFLFKAKEYDELSFARWLPHSWSPDGKVRMIAYDSRSFGTVLYELSDVIRKRLEREDGKAAKEDEKQLPHYVVFVTDLSVIAGEPASKFLLDPPKEAGITAVFCAETPEGLPAGCDTVVQDDDGNSAAYSISSQIPFSEDLVYDKLPLASMDRFARSLSRFELRDTSDHAEIPDMLTFLDMYKTSRVEELDVYHKWLENRTYETMKAMIGQKAGGKPIYLDIHEKYHGPHGLVAGTTGSGKSETLQTYILSLAINYHPHEVAFILIDYKGGGMARSFEGLPHLAGMITNLGGNATTRALLSIHAEIRRRQRVFNEYKIKHIDQYIELYRNGEADEPMPHLIIIADEFAELKKEQPEFVRALVSAARVGRSLGVNLILATQKPGGVVDDEIWSNSRFRIALRVADKQDSNEMLKRPDAAFITGTGRGFLQVGNDEIFEEFQSGWSGAQYTPEVPYDNGSQGYARMVDITGKSEKTGKKKKKGGDKRNKVTQLDAIVKYTERISAENRIEPLRQIWLPPLPDTIYLDELDPAELNRDHFAIPIGLADDPENQRQFTVALDFVADGHLLICGGAGSGKTTLIQTIVYSASERYSPEQLNFFIADFSGRTMKAFAGLPHTGAVCVEGEDDKIAVMMDYIRGELERRKALLSEKGIGSYRDYIKVSDDLPMILLIIDNYASFVESYEEYEELFIQLAREAAGYGIYMIFSCNSSGDLRGRIRQGFTKGIGMQLPDRFEYDSVIGMRTEILPDDRVSGRGLIKEGKPLEFQTALPVRSTGGSMMLTVRSLIAEKYPKEAGAAKKLVSRYEAYSDEALLPLCRDGSFLLGRSCADGAPAAVNTDSFLCFAVSGGPKSGKTNFLKFAARQFRHNGARVFIFDSVLRELEDFAAACGADGYMTDNDGLFHFMERVLVPELTERNELVYEARQEKRSVREALKGYDRIVLLINSAAEFMEAVYNSAQDMSEFLETVFAKGAEHKIHFLLAVSPREYNECSAYGAFRMACGMKTGLHLGGEAIEQGIFDFNVEDDMKRTPAGSALIQVDGKTAEIMTPLVKEGENE